MTITLSSEQEKLINEKVNSGAYKSASEVIDESLRLLEAKEESLKALRAEIMRGVIDIEEGQFTTLTTDKDFENFSDEIIKQGQDKFALQDKQ